MDTLDIEKTLLQHPEIDPMIVFKSTREVANFTLRLENVVKLMMDPNEQFDVVIAEWLYTELYAG